MNAILPVLFSFQGRIPRITWATAFLSLVLADQLFNILLRNWLSQPAPPVSPDSPFFGTLIRDRIDAITTAVFVLPQLAVDVKRWHDLNLSGWHVLIVYAPLLLILLLGAMHVGGTEENPEPLAFALIVAFFVIVAGYLITLAFRQGTAGANRFGLPTV